MNSAGEAEASRRNILFIWHANLRVTEQLGANANAAASCSASSAAAPGAGMQVVFDACRLESMATDRCLVKLVSLNGVRLMPIVQVLLF